MSYLVDLSNFEVVELLKQGSTNQRNFISAIEEANNIPEDVIEAIKNFDNEIGSQTDLRGWLNGGVMDFEPITEEIEENYCFIPCENGYGVVYY